MSRSAEKTDSQIQQDVLHELKWDTRVEETDVGVEVDAGIVTLTGTVESWAKKLAAQEAAHRVAGVRDVANDIRVKTIGSPGHTDTEIAQGVRSALQWDVMVPDQHIRSTVSEGVVTLEGDVFYGTQRDDCERAVRNLAGVRGVVNHIAVKPPIMKYDLRQAIEEALERRADREAKHLRIEVRDGDVTLSGVVHSWGERAAIIGTVKGTPGVSRVYDQLRTDPYAV